MGAITVWTVMMTIRSTAARMPCTVPNFITIPFYLANCIVTAIITAIIYMVYLILAIMKSLSIHNFPSLLTWIDY